MPKKKRKKPDLKPGQCAICGEKFMSTAWLTRHMDRKHPKNAAGNRRGKTAPTPKAGRRKPKKGKVSKRGSTPTRVPAVRRVSNEGMIGKLSALRDEFSSKAATLQEMIDQLKKL